MHLIDEETGEHCSDDWPTQNEHHHCIVRFGYPEWSHTRNALHVASSMCALSGGCYLPFVWTQSMLALAIGAWRDHSVELQKLCQ